MFTSVLPSFTLNPSEVLQDTSLLSLIQGEATQEKLVQSVAGQILDSHSLSSQGIRPWEIMARDLLVLPWVAPVRINVVYIHLFTKDIKTGTCISQIFKK